MRPFETGGEFSTLIQPRKALPRYVRRRKLLLNKDVRTKVKVRPFEAGGEFSAPSPDFSSYFAPELAVRSKRQITKGIGNEEAVEWKTVCVAPDQSVCSAGFAKRANAARDKRSILARTALSLRFCLVAAR